MTNNVISHLKTVATHRKYVRQMCFKLGLYWQGLVHDLSKYSLTELSICKYYTGKGSPHQVCRDVLGYSPSWNHHYHINKHHFQYWWDEDEEGRIIPCKMPYRYVIESVCDMIGASKAYNKDKFKPQLVLDYWYAKCKNKRIQHADSEMLTEFLIKKYVELGELEFINWYRENKFRIEEQYVNN